MEIQAFHDSVTGSLSYVVYHAESRIGLIIDPVLDFDPEQSVVATRSADALIDFAEGLRLDIQLVLETHLHADHLSAAEYLRQRLGARTGAGALLPALQQTVRSRFERGGTAPEAPHPFDYLLNDGECVEIGPLEVRAIHTPGHTPACTSYLIGDALFVGDVLFQPDAGTARCDFPGGSAETLYGMIQMLFGTLSPETRVFTGHDYQPGGRPVRYESTLKEQQERNIQVSTEISREVFVETRNRRDAKLAAPRLFLPALKWNAGLRLNLVEPSPPPPLRV